MCLVGVALGKAALGALRSASERRIIASVWRSVRPRHFVASLLLMVLVVVVFKVVDATGAWARFGLGTLLDTESNAVLAPVVAASEAAQGADWWGTVLMVAAALYVATFVALLPLFAYHEEVVFRAGLHR